MKSYIYVNTVELYAQNEDTGLSSTMNTIESVYPPSRRKKNTNSPCHFSIQSDSQHFLWS